jgi:four helix bundle protein
MLLLAHSHKISKIKAMNNQPRYNLILEKSFLLALQVVEYTEQLEKLGRKQVANQLIRSGTSIGANAHEAQAAESHRDFLHKMKIAAKEAHETMFWLKICKHSKSYPDCDDLMALCEENLKILNAITSSTRNKLDRR